MALSLFSGGRRVAHAGDARVSSPAPMLLAWRLAIVGALVVLAAVAWWMTDVRMAGMDAGPGTDPGALAFYVTTWTVMMAAMMFPSIAPMVLMYVGLQRGRRERGLSAPVGATASFVSGYLVIWAAAGLVGYLVLTLGRELDGGFFAWDRAGRNRTVLPWWRSKRILKTRASHPARAKSIFIVAAMAASAASKMAVAIFASSRRRVTCALAPLIPSA